MHITITWLNPHEFYHLIICPYGLRRWPSQLRQPVRKKDHLPVFHWLKCVSCWLYVIFHYIIPDEITIKSHSIHLNHHKVPFNPIKSPENPIKSD